MLTAKEIDRFQQMYEDAVSHYLDKTDFNPSDWMSEKEAIEYEELLEKDSPLN